MKQFTILIIAAISCVAYVALVWLGMWLGGGLK